MSVEELKTYASNARQYHKAPAHEHAHAHHDAHQDGRAQSHLHNPPAPFTVRSVCTLAYTKAY